jgi:hypothetical protein
MKDCILSSLVVGAAALAFILVPPRARAGVNTDTIGIHFGADEPTEGNGSMLDPTDVVGVPAVASANWNNVTKKGGVSMNLIRDTNGVATTTGAEVLWEATNTWASIGKPNETNNNFTGANATLMTGYLDQNTKTPSPTFVQIRSLPDDMAAGKYDVYLYMLSSTAGESAGEYTVNNAGPKFVVASGDMGQFAGPDFVEAKGDDPNYGSADFGNYVVFSGQTGSMVTITTVNLFDFSGGTDPRAALNAVQIVKNP